MKDRIVPTAIYPDWEDMCKALPEKQRANLLLAIFAYMKRKTVGIIAIHIHFNKNFTPICRERYISISCLCVYGCPSKSALYCTSVRHQAPIRRSLQINDGFFVAVVQCDFGILWY